MSGSDRRAIRRRTQALTESIDRRGRSAPAGGMMLCQVANLGNMPTSTDHYFACYPARLLGPETEGVADAPVVDQTAPMFVDVLGPRVPKAGDWIVAKEVGGRWAAQMSASSTCCCSCVPKVLTLTSFGAPTPKPDYIPVNPFGINPFVPSPLTCTFTYGPPPAPRAYVYGFGGFGGGNFSGVVGSGPGGYYFFVDLPTAWYAPIGSAPFSGSQLYYYLFIMKCRIHIMTLRTWNVAPFTTYWPPASPLDTLEQIPPSPACTVNPGDLVVVQDGASPLFTPYLAISAPLCLAAADGLPANTCEPFDIQTWSWQAHFPHGGQDGSPVDITAESDVAELVGEARSNADCVQLDTTDSAGALGDQMLCNPPPGTDDLGTAGEPNDDDGDAS